MKIEGSYTLAAARDIVWQHLMDPASLARALPGCEKLEPNPDGSFSAKLKVGVAAIKGVYNGKVTILDPVPPESYRMKVEGNGTGGFVKGEGSIALAEDSGKTVVKYSGDAQVGGLIASVGQRLILAAARMTAEQFFASLAKQFVAPATEVVKGPQD